MNWTLHVIGATGFFIVILYLIMIITGVVRKIWKQNKRFIPWISYVYKTNVIKAILLMILAYLANQLVPGLLPDFFGNVIEWVATFIVLIYIGTFSLDLWYANVYFTEEQTKWEQNNTLVQ